MTHKGTVMLETERLILRRFVAEDAEAMFRNWVNDPEVTRYLTWQPHGSIELLGCLELHDNTMVQAQGKCNQLLQSYELCFVEKWVLSKGVKAGTSDLQHSAIIENKGKGKEIVVGVLKDNYPSLLL